MDYDVENLNLFKKEKEHKTQSNDESIKNYDRKTGQLSFIRTEIKVEAIIKEALEPYTKELKKVKETNQNLSEQSQRLANSMEKMIPHIKNIMIGNEKDAYQVYCDNSECADIAKVHTIAPAELLYNLVSADLAKCFGCISNSIHLLLKDLDLWDDNKYTQLRKTGKSSTAKYYKPAIVNETYKRLEEFITSGKITSLTERRQEIYFGIYDHLKFFRTELPEKTHELQSDRALQSV